MNAIGTEPRLSLIMAAFNEEKTILAAVERVLEQPFVYELIVVDDGSTDSTLERVQALDDSRLVVIAHQTNKGKGSAIRSGIKVAKGKYIGVQDADLEYDPADLRRMLVPLDDGLADVVYGSRFLSSDYHRVLYYWHSLGNKILTTVSNMVTDLNLTDMETCYKVFRRDVIQSMTLQEDRFGFEPEVTVKLSKRNARIYEVGISYAGRTYAEGKKIGWRDGVSALRCLVKYRLQVSRRQERYR